jgi:pimeloyl-ACP methyl ester carboxylesterase
MSPSDARSRIALHMNWAGQTLPVLLCGQHYWKNRNSDSAEATLPLPATEEVQAVSSLAQIRAGSYKSPTFIIHGTFDDLIPLDQAQKTH